MWLDHMRFEYKSMLNKSSSCCNMYVDIVSSHALQISGGAAWQDRDSVGVRRQYLADSADHHSGHKLCFKVQTGCILIELKKVRKVVCIC